MVSSSVGEVLSWKAINTAVRHSAGDKLWVLTLDAGLDLTHVVAQCVRVLHYVCFVSTWKTDTYRGTVRDVFGCRPFKRALVKFAQATCRTQPPLQQNQGILTLQNAKAKHYTFTSENVTVGLFVFLKHNLHRCGELVFTQPKYRPVALHFWADTILVLVPFWSLRTLVFPGELSRIHTSFSGTKVVVPGNPEGDIKSERL